MSLVHLYLSEKVVRKFMVSRARHRLWLSAPPWPGAWPPPSPPPSGAPCPPGWSPAPPPSGRRNPPSSSSCWICQVILLAPTPAHLKILGTACMSSTLRSFEWSTLANLTMAHTLVLCSGMHEPAWVASMAAVSPARTWWNTLWGGEVECSTSHGGTTPHAPIATS